jgi:hypothetical protein
MDKQKNFIKTCSSQDSSERLGMGATGYSQVHDQRCQLNGSVQHLLVG